MIDLSIILLSYNVRDFLYGSLKSIFEYTGGLDFEVIVVDNASSDGSAEMVRRQFPQVILVANTCNTGFSCGNNVGMRCARGRAVMILNCDTEIRKNVFKELYEALFSDPHLGAVGPLLVYPDGRVQHYCARRNESLAHTLRLYYLPYFSAPSLYLRGKMDHPGLFKTEGLSGAAMMVRREVLNEVGGLDEGFWAYCEDADWSKRIAAAGYALACLNTVEVIHYHGKSLSQNELRRRTEAVRSEIRYFRKHGSAGTLLVYRLGVGLNLIARMLTLDLIRLFAGKPQRFSIDASMLRCVILHRVSDKEAHTRESVRQARL